MNGNFIQWEKKYKKYSKVKKKKKKKKIIALRLNILAKTSHYTNVWKS